MTRSKILCSPALLGFCCSKISYILITCLCFGNEFDIFRAGGLQWVPCKKQSSVNDGAWLWRFNDITRVAKTDILRLSNENQMLVKIIVLQKVILHYGKKSLF